MQLAALGAPPPPSPNHSFHHNWGTSFFQMLKDFLSPGMLEGHRWSVFPALWQARLIPASSTYPVDCSDGSRRRCFAALTILKFSSKYSSPEPGMRKNYSVFTFFFCQDLKVTITSLPKMLCCITDLFVLRAGGALPSFLLALEVALSNRGIMKTAWFLPRLQNLLGSCMCSTQHWL